MLVYDISTYAPGQAGHDFSARMPPTVLALSYQRPQAISLNLGNESTRIVFRFGSDISFTRSHVHALRKQLNHSVLFQLLLCLRDPGVILKYHIIVDPGQRITICGQVFECNIEQAFFLPQHSTT